MAQKRMFDKRVVESDRFTDLPNSSKALYFMAGMSADDKGFFQPRRLQKVCGFSDDDFKILIAKNFFITFESGVMVVTDWNKNNWLDSRRITETEYVEELKLLQLINEKYELIDSGLANAKRMLSEYSIEENSIEENNNIYGEFKNVKLTDSEYAKLEKSNLLPYIEKLSSYMASKNKRYKSHYATILTWARKDKPKEETLPEWFNQDIEKRKDEKTSKELEDMLKEFK